MTDTTTLARLKAKLAEVKAARVVARADESARVCRHLGPATGDKVTCPTCNGGGVKLKVFACAKHGRCTPGKPVSGVACCVGCPDKNPVGGGILLTGGIGDAFALEAMMTPEERDRLGAIYYGCPAAAEIETLFRALPNFPNLKDHVRLPTGRAVHYTRAAVEKHVGTLPAAVEDWSIAGVFPRHRPYTGSSFLQYRLASPVLPDRPYVVLAPFSTWGRNGGNRNFDDADWRACLDFLDARDLTGVVLLREKFPVPVHPRVLDWQARLNVLESVEVLKAARGYLGIDTCWSVLAAKLFPADRIAVKSVWGHCYANARSYFAPRTSFPFLKNRLEAPAWT